MPGGSALQSLQPQFTQTDLLGAMFIVSQSFGQAPPAVRKLLIVFSDMRQSTADLDLEHIAVSNTDVLLKKATHNSGVPDLSGVEVYALGVDSAGITYDRWRGIRNFWTEVFREGRKPTSRRTQFSGSCRSGGIAHRFHRRDVTCGVVTRRSWSKCIGDGSSG